MGNRRELAAGKEIWVIKAGFPNQPSKIQWSDYVFANTMKKYLERMGYYVEVESKDEWYDEEEADVVISLRGPSAYYPDRRRNDCIYILWNLSHPDTVTEEEYRAFDLVCIGSEKEAYLDEIRRRVPVPVESLPMCVDTELFHPAPDPSKGKQAEQWIFVGNSRNKERKSVIWAVRHGLPLKIWGAGWETILPESERYVVAENIKNQDVPQLYWNAGATINDHYEDMINNGFINTRVLEALACGLPVVSDDSETLTGMFGDAILSYQDEDGFLKRTTELWENYEVIKEKTLSLWPLIRERYSFAGVMKRLSQLKERTVREAEARKKDVEEMSAGNQILVENAVVGYYREWKQFFEAVQKTEMEIERLKNHFEILSYQEQKAYEALEYEEEILFRQYIKNEFDYRKRAEYLQRRTEELSAGLNVFQSRWEEEKARRKDYQDKFRKMYEKNKELYEKLQKTYGEKSEINRKLQITYGEKYDRGLEIKELKKEIDAIKKSETYRLARVLGTPIRIARKLFRKLQNTQ